MCEEKIFYILWNPKWEGRQRLLCKESFCASVEENHLIH
jgi:hypothetical protein